MNACRNLFSAWVACQSKCPFFWGGASGIYPRNRSRKAGIGAVDFVSGGERAYGCRQTVENEAVGVELPFRAMRKISCSHEDGVCPWWEGVGINRVGEAHLSCPSVRGVTQPFNGSGRGTSSAPATSIILPIAQNILSILLNIRANSRRFAKVGGALRKGALLVLIMCTGFSKGHVRAASFVQYRVPEQNKGQS